MVKIEKLSKVFKEKVLFKELDLQITKSEICGIIGKNGVGKSVLLKIIAGIMYPTQGKIVIDGIPLKEGNFPESIGIVLDNIGFLKEYSGYKNLKLIASIQHQISDERIKECMHLVGLIPEEKIKVGKYSLGMRQKLAIAQAIMEYPKLLLLDEPFNGLDEESVINIKELLIKINKDEKTTILIISHDKEDLENFCHKIIKIENKKLVNQFPQGIGTRDLLSVTEFDTMMKKGLEQAKNDDSFPITDAFQNLDSEISID